jgi:hypothetical protein
LRAALETARKNGGNGRTAKTKPRTTPSVVRHGGREPLGLGAAIGMLVNERAWELPAAGASLRERWEAIAPEFAAHRGAVPPRLADPAIAQAVERQNRALRELSRRAFPEPDAADDTSDRI